MFQKLKTKLQKSDLRYWVAAALVAAPVVIGAVFVAKDVQFLINKAGK